MNGVLHTDYRATRVRELFSKDASTLHTHGTLSIAPLVRLELVGSGMELSKQDLNSCIDLVEATSGKDYRASSIGWHRSAKTEEMMNPQMIYLLIHEKIANAGNSVWNAPQAGDTKPSITQQHKPNPMSSLNAQNNRILGFLSFMFTFDDPPNEDREVLYIYEIHLDEKLRGRGLGSALIKFAEHAAQHCSITKTMLTVFSANVGARALYKRLGYMKDSCSPEDRIMRRKVIKADYMILSKELGTTVVQY